MTATQTPPGRRRTKRNVAERELAAAARRGALRKHFETALAEGRIWPAFQPIVNTSTRAVVGFEVLSRWQVATGEYLSPQVFVPLIENAELAHLLFKSMVSQACAAAANWPAESFLAFNVAPQQLRSNDLPRLIPRLLEASGFPLRRFQCEVTEGTLRADEDHSFSILGQLSNLGIKIAIDDFGTAHSNLSRLEAFPFHKLKIDARFIKDLHRVASRRRIAAAIIGLGQSLGITVVAEGIEDAAEEKILRHLNCDYGQGWLYGEAVPASSIDPTTLRTEEIDPYRSHALPPFEQLHQLTALYDQSPVGLAFVDKNFIHVRANDLFAAMHGRTGREIIGKSVDDLMEGEVRRQAEATLYRASNLQQPARERYRLRDHDYVVFVTPVFDAGKELMGYSVVSIDETQRLSVLLALSEVELHCRQAARIHLNVPWSADARGDLIYIGPSITDRPAETMQERIDSWHERLHPEDRAQLREKWIAWIPCGEPYEGSFRVMAHDGVYRLVRSRAFPVRAEDGSIQRWDGVFWEMHSA